MSFSRYLRLGTQFRKLITSGVLQSKRYASSDTVFNLASGPGKCGVAVIRVSGPDVKHILSQMINTDQANTFNLRPRYASLRKIRHPKMGHLIDEGIVLWFPGPNSFTGEDCCEFHVHGSIAVITAMKEAINSVSGARPSLPGEFTRRAYRSGKLDLSKIEGLADLIHAETEVQRKQALLQVQGITSQLYNKWRTQLLQIIAHLEAYIDFGDDQDIESEINILETILIQTRNVRLDIENYLKDSRKGEMRRFGIRTVILGEPNVGKSSFMNHICRKPISIVANIPGTTRDIIESSFNIAGYPILLADTAGLRLVTDDPVEIEGIARAVNYARTADLIVLIMDATKLCEFDFNVQSYQTEYLKRLGVSSDDEITRKPCLIIVNKIDLLPKDLKATAQYAEPEEGVAYISCTEDIGITAAVGALENILDELCGDSAEGNPALCNERHRQLLSKCFESLLEFEENLAKSDAYVDYAHLAQQLRDSVRCIGYITGAINTEEVLDVIFKDFCIGK